MNGPAPRAIVRWATGLLIVVHGLVHLLGAAEGLRWADVERLDEPTSGAWGVVWLAAAALTIASGVLLIARVHRWWVVGAAAIALSQLAIITSWPDAKAGTVVNVVLLVAVVHATAAGGERSARARFRAEAARALARPAATSGPVTAADLERLPPPVAAYVRRSGAVGQPRVANFHAHVHGRIRAGADQPWMSYVAEQVNGYGARPSRLFFMDATRFGLPIDVLHEFVDASATMRVKACSLVTMADASGPDLTRAETVTLFNDMCILAPAALVDAPITWTTVDDHRANGRYTVGANTVGADLVFDDEHDLVDFVSDDRLAASADGTTFTRRRWSTPVSGYADIGGRRVATVGRGRWHPDDGAYTYLEFVLDGISYNVASAQAPQGAGDPDPKGLVRS